MSRTRVMAIVHKELRDYQRNRYMLVTTAIIPIIFLLQPLISILSLPAAAALPLSRRHELIYLLAIPALVPSFIAAASIVTERQQGTLEPVLTTPIRREEFLLAKALAPLVPAVTVSYLV
jgi:ABC-type Na+ efflux pump permease subunit